MSRTASKGLNYFPIDVTVFTDIKIRKLIKYQGGKSFTVYAYLLCNIYQNGYFLKWDDELPFIISEITGYDEAYISEVINCCLKVDLLSQTTLDNEGILTSKGIKERFLKICKDAKRVVPPELITTEEIAITTEVIPITTEEIAITTELGEQSKVKKRKEEKSKENESKEGLEKSANALPFSEINPEQKLTPSQQKLKEKEKKIIALAKNSYESQQCQFSNDFKKIWVELCGSPKWYNKPQSAINQSLKMVMEFPEEYAKVLIRTCIAGNNQGLVFPDSKQKFEQYLKKENGTNSTYQPEYVKRANDRAELSKLTKQLLLQKLGQNSDTELYQ